MTDQEIIQGLIDRDNRVTKQFFYVKCRPLLRAIMRLVFNHPVDYDEVVSELYEYVMADNSAKLRQFQYRSSLYQWMKVVATKFFIRHRDNIIGNTSKEPPYEYPDKEDTIDIVSSISDRIDLTRMLEMMDNQRYADAIRHLIIEDMQPERYAAKIGVSVDNLYNIKKRAISALTQIAIKYYSYGR